MGSTQMREELHQFINQADVRVLNLLYGMMKADKAGEILTIEQQDDLEIRINRHKKGQSKSYSWSEARAQIERQG